MTAYYNEIDPHAAEWLRVLILEGVIAPGDVDERSIEDVVPSDLRGYTQCHFFAGIGGWSYALRLAGWSDDRPVWTGSCPCQPFSAAGKGKGFADERHLWPAWYHLVRQCRPAILFGEQVANSDLWFGLVSADLEAEGYAVGSTVLGAHSVGAPHIRQRRYFVAHHQERRRGEERSITGGVVARDSAQGRPAGFKSSGSAGVAANRRRPRLEIIGVEQARRQRATVERGSAAGVVEHASSNQRDARGTSEEDGDRTQQSARPSDAWTVCEWLNCRDGKARPVEPGTFPLAHGVSGRVGLLRGYGNAIVPQVAAAFIEASMT
jgi:DNA (cytosine-5)-methyltransferase 1